MNAENDDSTFVSIHYIICECGQTFPTENGLRAHLIKEHPHKRERKEFKCGVCGSIFAQEQECISHYEELHMDDRDEECDIKPSIEEFVGQECEVAYIPETNNEHIEQFEVMADEASQEHDGELHNVGGHEEHTHVQEYVSEDIPHGISQEETTRATEILLKTSGQNGYPQVKPPSLKMVRDPDTGSLVLVFNRVPPRKPRKPLPPGGRPRARPQHTLKHIVCETCGKKYASNAALKYHQRVHSGEKPYQCQMCPKAFTMPLFLQIHERTHTGERPYQCPECPKAFSNRAALLRHERMSDELIAHEFIELDRESHYLKKKRRRDVRMMYEPINELDEEEFIKKYRLTKEIFIDLCNELRPFLKSGNKANDLTVEKKVLTALSFYATGSYQRPTGDISAHCMAQQTVSKVITEVTAALNVPHFRRKYICFPSTNKERNEIRIRFYEKFKFPGVLGCIDCTHVAIIKPNENKERYYCRKQYHSLNVQLVHSGVKPYTCPMCMKSFTQSNSLKLHVATVHLKQPAPYKSKDRRAREQARVRKHHQLQLKPEKIKAFAPQSDKKRLNFDPESTGTNSSDGEYEVIITEQSQDGVVDSYEVVYEEEIN